jgi:hypothetical protein
MKKTIIENILMLVLGALTAQIAQAQGSVAFLSNLAQSSTGSIAVGSDSWVAPLFYSGNNPGGYVFNSVQLAMTDSTGSPSGFTVMVYSVIGVVGANPGSSLGALTGSTSPTIAGTYTYTSPSGISLAPHTAYFIVLTSATMVASGACEWSLSGINSYNPSDGWAVTGGISSSVLHSSNGSSWSSLSATYPQFAINATPAPEPGVLGLFALGGLLVACQHRRTRSP